MAEKSRGFLFRKRNILGAALVAGIGLGIYLGKFQFGFGGGNSMGIGLGDGQTSVSIVSDQPKKTPLKQSNEETGDLASLPVPEVVRVLIDDRDFLVRSEDGAGKNRKISLPNLIDLIKKTTGDADGLRVRIYQKTTARASAEESLKKELAAAGIEDTAVFWVPTPVK